jgi:hypothetical protein
LLSSPSLTISIPHSTCWRTTSATALCTCAANVFWSKGWLFCRARIISWMSTGRGMLPTCVVRILSLLRFIVSLPFSRCSQNPRLQLFPERSCPPCCLAMSLGLNVTRVRVPEQEWGAARLAGDDLLLEPGQRQRSASRKQQQTYEAGVGVSSYGSRPARWQVKSS